MKRHNVILESNVEPKDHNVLWLQGNKLKKFGNTGWEDIVNEALALGAFHGYFPDSISLPTDVTTLGYAYVGLGNPYEIWNFNGESWSDSGTSINMNDADEEDITRNTDGKLQFKDRVYGDGMGYVILRKDKAFAEQVIQENTIYEIRYDFDLNGEEVELPSHSVIYFNRGKLLNGTMIGQSSQIDGLFVTLTEVLNNISLDGTYTNTEESFSWWGGVSNSQESADAQKNLDVLSFMAKCRLNIKFDGEYHISNDRRVVFDYVVHMYGNGIVHNALIAFANGGGLVAHNVSFMDDSGNQSFIDTETLLNITIPVIELHDCTFSYFRVVSLNFQDINSNETHLGINNFIIDGCRFLRGAFRIMNCPFWTPSLLTNNRFENATVSPIYISWGHSKKLYPEEEGTYNYVEEGLLNTPKFTISGNYFKGNVVSFNYYYCSTLLCTNVVEFCNNYIEDFINYAYDESTPFATCYDAYFDCAEVYYHDNIIKNVFAFAKNGASIPQCEIFKSKINPLKDFGRKMIRKYTNNIWTCDAGRVAEYSPDGEIIIGFLRNTDTAQVMRYEGNDIELNGITLMGKSSGYGGSENFFFFNNTIKATKFTEYFWCFYSASQKLGDIIFEKNTFITSEYCNVMVVDSSTNRARGVSSLIARNNTCINGCFVAYVPKADTYIVRENTGDFRILKTSFFPCYDGTKTPFVSQNMDIEYSVSNLGEPTGKDMSITVSGQTKGCITFLKKYFESYKERIIARLSYADVSKFIIQESYSVNGTPKNVFVEFVNSGGTLQVKINGVTNELSTVYTKVYDEDNLSVRVKIEDATSMVATVEIGNITGLTSANDRTVPIKVVMMAL